MAGNSGLGGMAARTLAGQAPSLTAKNRPIEKIVSLGKLFC